MSFAKALLLFMDLMSCPFGCGGSLSDPVCNQFREDVTTGECANCKSARVTHEWRLNSAQLSSPWKRWLELYIAIRNCRVLLLTSLDGDSCCLRLSPISMASLRTSAAAALGDKTLMHSEQLMQSLVTLLDFISSQKLTIENILRHLELLDDAYYNLYYCVDLNYRRRQSSAPVQVPPPHEYFSSQTCNPGALNAAFKNFVSKNISSPGKQYIRSIWGLDCKSGSPFQDNPLLLLHFSRWRESVVLLPLAGATPAGTSSLIQQLESSPDRPSSTNSLTMKGRDPMLPPKLRSWNDSSRVWPCHLYSFATPSPSAVDRLVQLSPVVEIGAGTGYWAYMIRNEGATVFAYDKDPPSVSLSNAYHGRGRQWTTVQKGGPERAAHHPSASLLLCYPPPDCDMGIRAINAYSGSTICYVGEWQGDTGTKGFENSLSTNFECIELIPLPNWIDTCYSLSIWRRKKPGTGPVELKHPFQCTSCGAIGKPLYRCRITYAIYFCDNLCAAQGARKHFDELAIRSLITNGAQDLKKSEAFERVEDDSRSDISRKRVREKISCSRMADMSLSQGGESSSDVKKQKLEMETERRCIPSHDVIAGEDGMAILGTAIKPSSVMEVGDGTARVVDGAALFDIRTSKCFKRVRVPH